MTIAEATAAAVVMLVLALVAVAAVVVWAWLLWRVLGASSRRLEGIRRGERSWRPW